MNPANNLEIHGNLTTHPLAELLAEILQSGIDGSLRLAQKEHKVIVYFKAGELVFAVSNQRRHRIFELLLAAGVLTRQQLVEITDFTNDLVLLKALAEKALLPPTEIELLADRQLDAILQSTLAWRDGPWTFSPLARVKDEMRRRADVYSRLIEIARAMPKDAVVRRYKSLKETFARRPQPPAHISLRPEESFLLTRIDAEPTRIDDIRAISGMPETETMQTIYVLWLGGFLARGSWNSAFTPPQLAAIQSAKLELRKQTAPAAPKPAAAAAVEPPQPDAAPDAGKAGLTLEKYLAQVENGETFYEILGISHRAEADAIKQAYFGLAKRFHPDIFHRQTDAVTLQRLQHAFSEIAHAYETLRDREKRETYDFKLAKLLKELDKLGAAAAAEKPPREQQQTLTQAADIFAHGLQLIEQEQYEEAKPYLIRALHLAPEVARHHAYFGKLLALDKNQRFKAEAELQAAIKIEPQNPEFRFMLAEFFASYNLVRRAEGELNRLFEFAPNYAPARALLDTLRKK